MVTLPTASQKPQLADLKSWDTFAESDCVASSILRPRTVRARKMQSPGWLRQHSLSDCIWMQKRTFFFLPKLMTWVMIPRGFFFPFSRHCECESSDSRYLLLSHVLSKLHIGRRGTYARRSLDRGKPEPEWWLEKNFNFIKFYSNASARSGCFLLLHEDTACGIN